jgi:hypothetical protein
VKRPGAVVVALNAPVQSEAEGLHDQRGEGPLLLRETGTFCCLTMTISSKYRLRDWLRQ